MVVLNAQKNEGVHRVSGFGRMMRSLRFTNPSLASARNRSPTKEYEMINYRLKIIFKAEDLPGIYQAKELVTLMKPASPDRSVVWAMFNPFENNTIEWSDGYALYASSTRVEDDGQIEKLSETQAHPQLTYTFSNGTFSSPSSDAELGRNEYKIVNEMVTPTSLVFGLAQSVSVNGSTNRVQPINATHVPARHSVTFAASEEILLFLRARIQSGAFIARVKSPQTHLTFDDEISEVTVKYEASLGQFIKQ